MQLSIVRQIFRRVQLTPSEGLVLDAILSQANLYGKHARVAYACLAGLTGLSVRQVQRLVWSLEHVRRLVRVDRRRLWPGHNAINVYHVVVPWRGWSESNIKGDRPCHSPIFTHEDKKEVIPVSEEMATRWWTPGSQVWYAAQGR
jgi:hypothetical protein